MNLYRFYFHEKDKPILIEAKDRQSARIKLQEIIPQLKERGYFLDELARETVELLIDDVSTKTIQSKQHVWKNGKWQLVNP